MGLSNRHEPDPDAQPVPQERTWSVAAVRAACEAERRAVEARGYPLAVCHGDLKPSNLLHDGRHAPGPVCFA